MTGAHHRRERFLPSLWVDRGAGERPNPAAPGEPQRSLDGLLFSMVACGFALLIGYSGDAERFASRAACRNRAR